MLSRRDRRLTWAAVPALLVMASQAASGQDRTWNKNVGGDWKTAANWKPAVVPDGGASAILPDGLSAPATIALDKTYSIQKLTITSTDATKGYTVASDGGGKGQLKFVGTATIEVTADNTAVETISVPVLIDAGQKLTVTNDGKAQLAISGVISGAKADGVTFDGPGEVLLTGVNTYKGGTTVDGGLVSIRANSALGDNKGQVVLGDGGVLRGLGNVRLAAARTISLGDGLLTGSGVLSGDPDLKSVFTVASKITTPAVAAGEFLGILDKVRLTNTDNDFKADQGILVGTADTPGFLLLRSDKALGDATNKIVLTRGTIVAEDTFTSARAIGLDLPGAVRVVDGKTLTLSGVISGGNSTFTKEGPGTLVLSGKNTYGRTKIAEGTLEVSANNNLGKAGGRVTIESKGTLQVDAPFKTDRNFVVNSGTINVAFPRNPAAGQDFEIKGVVSGKELIKTGPGFLTLSNKDNTQSATTIAQGPLAVGSDGALGKADGKLTIQRNATLEVTDSFTTSRPIVVQGGTEGARIRVDKGATLTVDSGITATIARFVKEGRGTLVLSKGSTSNIGVDAVITSGKIQIDGDFTTFKGLFNDQGGTVGGKGTITGLFDNKGKVAAGGDPGTLTVTGDTLMESGSRFEFDINAANGTPGGSLGWGLLAVGGRLELLGSQAVDLQTFALDGNLGPMDPSLFDPTRSYRWEFAVAAGGIDGFSPGLFSIDTGGFLNPLPPGASFGVEEIGNALFIDYSPAAVPEPSSLLLLALGVPASLAAARAAAARRRRPAPPGPDAAG